MSESGDVIFGQLKPIGVDLELPECLILGVTAPKGSGSDDQRTGLDGDMGDGVELANGTLIADDGGELGSKSGHGLELR